MRGVDGMLLLMNMTLKKINILEYAFGEGGGGHQKAYAVYAFINVDNCERPLSKDDYNNGMQSAMGYLEHKPVSHRELMVRQND